MIYRVFLGLGSNLGARQDFLNRAAVEIARLPGGRLVWCSPVYETEPYGNTSQGKFLNAVAELETRGIGRPSTYATIIETIEQRGYVRKRGTALVPSWVAFAVTNLLEQHFGPLVDYDFTARLEDGLVRLDAVQAQAILDMRLQRLTGLETDKIVAEHKEVTATIADLKDILADPAMRSFLDGLYEA